MKKIIGMIHLAGNDFITRGLEEIKIYEEYGLYAVLIENYHTDREGVVEFLEALQEQQEAGRRPKTYVMTKRDRKREKIWHPKIRIGVNILPNDYVSSLSLANEFGLEFIQLDYIAGNYDYGRIDSQDYIKYRYKYSNIKVYGGVWPKYYTPVKGSVLEDDLNDAMSRCDSIVVTGECTGKQTPLEKIVKFRKIIGDKELIIGAGLDDNNAKEQLTMADGVIIGSYFKNGDTRKPVDIEKVKKIMEIVKQVN